MGGTGGTADYSYLGDIDMFSLIAVGAGGYLDGSNETNTRLRARAMAFVAAHTGIIIEMMAHYEAEFSIQQWEWAVDEWAKFGDAIKVTSHQIFRDDVVKSGMWTDDGDGTFSRDYGNGGGDYSLLEGSPCIDAGTDVGIATDFLGNTVPQGAAPDIGAYEFLIPDIVPPVVTATPGGGTYRFSQSVVLSANEPATIYYTLDGSTPTSSSAVYCDPLTISSTTILKFIAVDTLGNAGEIQSIAYVIDTVSPTVTATPEGGSYISPQTVTLEVNEPATIYYTLDGSTPTSASAVYSGPLSLDRNTTLKYFVIDSVGNESVVTTTEYIIEQGAAYPVPSLGIMGILTAAGGLALLSARRKS